MMNDTYIINQDFCCFGTYDRNLDKCLIKCPDSFRCQMEKERRYEKLRLERENKNAENLKE